MSAIVIRVEVPGAAAVEVMVQRPSEPPPAPPALPRPRLVIVTTGEPVGRSPGLPAGSGIHYCETASRCELTACERTRLRRTHGVLACETRSHLNDSAARILS
jgi:hypothetical protein